jgi:ketosteroid isomerase-like protein
MADDIAILKAIYDRFNARDIDGVLDALTTDVAWANGMEGGHVHGQGAVRDYWTRQWAVVSPHVEPLSFDTTSDGSIVVEVQQSVRDVQGQPLKGQTHGLKDRTVVHIFQLRDGKVARFDIRADS